jgi:hypothetical protein
MKLLKEVKDMVFDTQNVYGEEMEVSEPIVMASAAGWYVGAVCKGEYGIEPFDRYSEYHETSELAQKILASELFDPEWYHPSSKIVPDTFST